MDTKEVLELIPLASAALVAVASAAIAVFKSIRAGKAEKTVAELDTLLSSMIAAVEFLKKMDPDEDRWKVYSQQLYNMQTKFGANMDMLIPKLREIKQVVQESLDDLSLDDVRNIDVVTHDVARTVSNLNAAKREEAKPKSGIVRAVMITLFCAAVIFLTAGCAPLWERTAGQESSVYRRMKYYEPAEKIAVLSRTTTTTKAPDGTVTEVIDETYGAPHIPKESVFKTGASFEDSDLSVDEATDNLGSGMKLTRKGEGNAGTLELTTTAQTIRTNDVAEMTGNIVEGATKGAVKAAMEYMGVVVPEKEQTKRENIAAKRDVRLKEIEHAPDHSQAPQAPETTEAASTP